MMQNMQNMFAMQMANASRPQMQPPPPQQPPPAPHQKATPTASQRVPSSAGGRGGQVRTRSRRCSSRSHPTLVGSPNGAVSVRRRAHWRPRLRGPHPADGAQCKLSM